MLALRLFFCYDIHKLDDETGREAEEKEQRFLRRTL
jgi:hypothetical protein